MYLLNTVVGIVGNFLVVFIVYKNKNMQTTTNYLLSNLAAADFMSLILCPIPLAVDLSNNHIGGRTGQFICKVFTGGFLSQLAKSVAFSSIIVLATERYYAIMAPFDTRFNISKDNVGLAIGIIWATAMVICGPFVIWSEFDEESNRCLDPLSLEKASSMKPYITAVVVTFVCVAYILFYCYAQILRGIYITKTVCSENVAVSDQTQLVAKKKLAVMSVSVTISFCTCYAPSVFFQQYLAFANSEEVILNYETLYFVHSVLRFILYLGSSLNPLVYAFQSSSYRKNVKHVFIVKRRATVGVIAVNEIEMANGRRQAGAFPVINSSLE